MKTPRKKLTNKDFENRINFLMMELENFKRVSDSMFMVITSFIRMEGKEEALKKYMEKEYKEEDDVQTELQKSGS